MDESGRENNPMLSAIAPVGKVDFDLLSLGVILKKGRGKNQFMNGGEFEGWTGVDQICKRGSFLPHLMRSLHWLLAQSTWGRKG